MYGALVALALIAVASVIAAWKYWPTDSSTKATIGQALIEFRRIAHADPSRDRAVDGLPTPGVYGYAISGGERLDSVLSGRHDYRGVAPILVTASTCGIEERWSVLHGRWSHADLCLGQSGKLQLVQLYERHEFFGNVEDTSYRCSALARVGATRCSSPNSSVVYSTRNLGRATITASGKSFSAEHLESRATFSGESKGTGEIEEWRRVTDGLLLKKRVKISAEVASVIGSGEYDESYRMSLLKITPSQ